MKNVYLVIPQKNNSLVKEEIYKKGKLKLSISSTWKKCVLITDSIPKSKIIDGIKITEFKNIQFKENEFDFKTKLVLPDELTETEREKLKNIFKDGFTWMLDSEGWKPSKLVYRLKGEFNAPSVPVHKLTLFTSEIELIHRSITSEEFQDYSKNGMPRSLFEDSVETSAPIFDDLTSLTIDEVEVPNFQKNFKIQYDLAVKDTAFEPAPFNNKLKTKETHYAVIGESWIKRSWYDLIIYEDFDFSKIEISVSRDYVFGKEICYETFSLLYDKIEFEFRENFGANSSDFSLIDNKGNVTNLNLFDDDDEDEDEDE